LPGRRYYTETRSWPRRLPLPRGSVPISASRHLLSPELVKDFISEFHRETNRLTAERGRRSEAAKAELARVEGRNSQHHLSREAKHDVCLDARCADGIGKAQKRYLSARSLLRRFRLRSSTPISLSSIRARWIGYMTVSLRRVLGPRREHSQRCRGDQRARNRCLWRARRCIELNSYFWVLSRRAEGRESAGGSVPAPSSSGGLWDLTRFAKPRVRWGRIHTSHPLSHLGGALQGGVIVFQDYSQAKDYRRIADRVKNAVT
jgi:hypothetical protein